MDLLNRLNKQAVELWQRQALCKDQVRREQLLKEFRMVYGQYQKHRAWLKLLGS